MPSGEHCGSSPCQNPQSKYLFKGRTEYFVKNVEYIGGMFRNTKSVLVRASQEAS